MAKPDAPVPDVVGNRKSICQHGMTLTFTHGGQRRTLAKHPAVRQQLARGEITRAEAQRRPWYLRLSDRSFKLPRTTTTPSPPPKTSCADVCSAPTNSPRGSRSKTPGTASLSASSPPTGSPRPASLAHQAPIARLRQRLRSTIERALSWWQDRPARNITAVMHEEYVAHRQAHTDMAQPANAAPISN